ncbi:MAG TPA: hypothetical protein VHE30_10450 [Polyangiaceae bacterium]|nr:hypothetical protein [Polyangiaceae bacterium]
MTEEHFTAIVQAAEAKKDDKGWFATQEGRHITLYVSAEGSSLTVSRVEALRLDGGFVKARSVRGEVYILALEDVFAGAVEPQPQGGRRAGFG